MQHQPVQHQGGGVTIGSIRKEEDEYSYFFTTYHTLPYRSRNTLSFNRRNGEPVLNAHSNPHKLQHVQLQHNQHNGGEHRKW